MSCLEDGTFAIAQDIKASLAYLPSSINIYVEMVKALDAVYVEGRILYEEYPFARAVNNVTTGEADFELPFLINPLLDVDTLPYRYVSAKLDKIAPKLSKPIFVIYSQWKGKDG